MALRPATGPVREDLLPLLADKTAQGTATMYVCRDFACQAPLVGAEAVEAALKDERVTDAARNFQTLVHIIAGPNGAGKTTFARDFLPDFASCKEFVNADLIAQGLSPFASEGAALAAGRLMLERLEELGRRRENFAFETTLAGRGYVAWLRRLRKDGYVVQLYFLWLPTVDISLARVAYRVKHGGHFVPDEDVRRRFVARPTESLSSVPGGSGFLDTYGEHGAGALYNCF